MNFLSHFYLDRQSTDSLFVSGTCTPDLMSIFNRTMRVKHHSQVIPLGSETFYQGVLRHYAADKAFHSCDFFLEESHNIALFLRKSFPSEQVHRTFFVGHVLVELLIDKILIGQDERLVGDFYAHLEVVSPQTLSQTTQHFVTQPLLGYEAFLQRFIQNRYLFHYSKYEYIIFVLKQIVSRVGISQTTFMDSPTFLDYLMEYEKELIPKVENLFVFLHQELDE